MKGNVFIKLNLHWTHLSKQNMSLSLYKETTFHLVCPGECLLWGIDVECLTGTLQFTVTFANQTPHKTKLNPSQMLGNFVNLSFFWKCGKFYESGDTLLDGSCVFLSNDISLIAIGYLWAKIRRCECGYIGHKSNLTRYM